MKLAFMGFKRNEKRAQTREEVDHMGASRELRKRKHSKHKEGKEGDRQKGAPDEAREEEISKRAETNTMGKERQENDPDEVREDE